MLTAPRVALAALGTTSLLSMPFACSSSSSTADTADASSEASTPRDSGAGDGGSAIEASTDASTTPVPPTAEAITGLLIGDGFVEPRALAAPLNTVGWEDSPQISAAGTLYFAYARADYNTAIQGVYSLLGPKRPGQTRDTPEIFEARVEAGAWNIVVSEANYQGLLPESAESVDQGENIMALIRYDGPNNEGDIMLSTKVGGAWQPSQRLPAPVNSACIEDHASLSADGKRLYFDSNRADVLGTTCKTQDSGAPISGARDIYVSTLTNGEWGAPVPVLGEPANGTPHFQPYAGRDETELYWTSGFDATCGATFCKYRATRQADGSFQNRAIVMRATPQAAAQPGDATGLGQIAITPDGKYMYFAYITPTSLDGGFDGGVEVNLNIGVAHRP